VKIDSELIGRGGSQIEIACVANKGNH